MEIDSISEKIESNQIKSRNSLEKIKSQYILQILFSYTHQKKSLELVNYNKKFQQKLNISIKNYKEYSEQYSSIEIEIIPAKNKYSKFININKGDESYYHIYLNSNEEIKRTFLEKDKDKNIKKINIIIDYQIKSFKQLFYDCECIEKINFKKFNRININNMSDMFRNCSSLKELNLSNFNTNNVNYMNGMFRGCSLLKELNLSNFNTNNVIDMFGMFYGCSSLKELNLSNFNTNKVKFMSDMFNGCSSLKELNITNFNIDNVTDMSDCFCGCSSLKELNISNLDFTNVTNLKGIFEGCSSLTDLDLSKFTIDDDNVNTYSMFKGCSKKLKKKIETYFQDVEELEDCALFGD